MSTNDGRRRRSIAALTLLAVIAAAPFALAQTGKKPGKKKPKPTPAATEAPPPEPAPAPTPTETTPPPPPAPEPTPEATATAPAKEQVAIDDSLDLTEKPTETYRFVGLRYRGTVIPKFMINLFADEGATVYSNSIGIEYEVRRDGFSMIPWLTYTEYGFGDTLFHEKGQQDLQQWYSDVSSSLKGVYAGVDLLWSTQVSKNVAIEYGGGAGFGFIFGSLTNDWVFQTDAGPLVSGAGVHYAPCPNTSAGPGCDPKNHQNAQVAKVGGYQEKNWFNGGSIPVLFPHLSIPEIGVRFKPINQLQLRASVGFSLTGFFFQLGASYGLPNKSESSAPASPPASEGESSK